MNEQQAEPSATVAETDDHRPLSPAVLAARREADGCLAVAAAALYAAAVQILWLDEPATGILSVLVMLAFLWLGRDPLGRRAANQPADAAARS